jgi:hypothetical protein
MGTNYQRKRQQLLKFTYASLPPACILLTKQALIYLFLTVLNTLQNSKLSRIPEDDTIVSKHKTLCAVHVNLIEVGSNGIYATEFTTNVTYLRTETCCVIFF